MADAKQPQQPEEPKALFTVDLTSDGTQETGGQAVRRVSLGIVLLLVGVVLAIGSFALFIATFLVPALFDWADLIWEFWWVLGGAGLALIILGFTIARHRRNRNRALAEEAYDNLAAVGIIDDETATTTGTTFDGTNFGKDDNPNRTPPPSVL